MQSELPVDARSQCVTGLCVCQSFQELEESDQCQAQVLRRCKSATPLMGLLPVKFSQNAIELFAHLNVKIPASETGAGSPSGLFRDRGNCFTVGRDHLFTTGSKESRPNTFHICK